MILKVLIVSLSLISWTPEFNFITSTGFTYKKSLTNDYPNYYGINYRLLIDCFVVKNIGLGVDFGKQDLENKDNNEERNIFLIPYVIGGLPINSKFKILTQLGVGRYFYRYNGYNGDKKIDYNSFSIGFRLQMFINKYFQTGLLYDEKMNINRIYPQELNEPNSDWVFYRSFSLYLGLVL